MSRAALVPAGWMSATDLLDLLTPEIHRMTKEPLTAEEAVGRSALAAAYTMAQPRPRIGAFVAVNGVWCMIPARVWRNLGDAHLAGQRDLVETLVLGLCQGTEFGDYAGRQLVFPYAIAMDWLSEIRSAAEMPKLPVAAKVEPDADEPPWKAAGMSTWAWLKSQKATDWADARLNEAGKPAEEGRRLNVLKEAVERGKQKTGGSFDPDSVGKARRAGRWHVTKARPA